MAWRGPLLRGSPGWNQGVSLTVFSSDACGLLPSSCGCWQNIISCGYSSGPQPFWHQGPVSWKTIFPQMGGGGWFRMIQVHSIYCALYFYYYYIVLCNEIIIQLTILLTGGGAQAVIWAMGSRCKYRWSFPRWPTAQLLLCGLVCNKPRIGTSLWPGGWGPLGYKTKIPLFLLAVSQGLFLAVRGGLQFLLCGPLQNMAVCFFKTIRQILYLPISPFGKSPVHLQGSPIGQAHPG